MELQVIFPTLFQRLPGLRLASSDVRWRPNFLLRGLIELPLEDARLHRNLTSASHFQFISVAHWETEEAFIEARARNKDIMQGIPGWKGSPALYEVSVSY